MQVIMYQANAFTDKLFEGSPIGIVPDAKNLTKEDMSRIVKITNLNKIAFIISKGEDCFNIRFFNSEEEVVFCDCATVASFYALAQRGYIKGVENGCVRAYQCTEVGKKPIDIYFKDWEVDRVELCEQKPVVISDNVDLDELSLILNIDKEQIGISNFNIKPEVTFKGLKDMIVPIKNSEVLDNLIIDVDKIKSSELLKDVDRVYVFSIDEKEVINYICIEFKQKESCVNEDDTSGLMYYIKKNKLLEKSHFIYKNKSLKQKYNYMHCEIIENKDGYPIKIGGRASIYLEGVVTFGDQIR